MILAIDFPLEKRNIVIRQMTRAAKKKHFDLLYIFYFMYLFSKLISNMRKFPVIEIYSYPKIYNRKRSSIGVVTLNS